VLPSVSSHPALSGSWLLSLLLAGALGVGCGSNNSNADGGTDGGLPDGAVVLPDGNIIFPDGGLPDGAVVLPDGNVIFPDAGLPDGAVVLPDGNVIFPDAGVDVGVNGMDAGPLPDLGIPPDVDVIPAECLDSNGDVDLCSCLVAPDCSSVACPTGTTCVDDGCGGQRCMSAGHPCVDASDCPAGGTCEDSVTGRSCRAPSAVCRDDRECPLGFSCEADVCVNRRVPCDTEAYSCPVGYVCDFLQQQSQAFCRRIDVPCNNSAVCVQPGACYDLDGDGSKECVPAELSCVPSVCAPDSRICGAQPEEKGYTCGFLGSCVEQPCESPFACVDYAGDGRPFCAAPGSCDAHSDCGPGELCALPHTEMSPRCVGPANGGTP
jgi:hypothetical protein